MTARGWQKTYVDAPELLNAVKADDFLEQLIPVLLAALRLGEPECPGVLQLMLDIEVGRVVEDGHDLAVGGATATIGRAVRGISHGAVGGNGNGIQWNRL